MNAAARGELEHIWSLVQAEVAGAVPEPAYRMWLEPLKLRDRQDGRLFVEAPPQALTWISERFGRLLGASATLVLGTDSSVELIAPGDGAPQPPPRRRAAAGRARDSRTPQAGAAVDSGAVRTDPLDNPKLTFEQFVIGDCNRLAHAAALTVAEMPAQAYNPLFVFGPPGVGKTHLLGAIAKLVLTHNPGLSVRWTTGEAFTNEFLAALADGRVDAFKARFRDVDLLLVDDVQFLERKTRTEEEFFHTFNALHDGGRQLVLTSDRPPDDLRALEDRLRARFSAGLVADIKPPELATRMTILRKRVVHDRIQLADERALSVIAQRVAENVRALEGALIRVVAFSSLTARPLTAELAGEVLDSIHPARQPQGGSRTIAQIQAAACAQFHVTPQELLSAARTPRIAWPRQLAMYLARELTSESLPAIGRQFGGRDHTTVLHAWRRTARRLTSDQQARASVERLRTSLGPELEHTAEPPDRSA